MPTMASLHHAYPYSPDVRLPIGTTAVSAGEVAALTTRLREETFGAKIMILVAKNKNFGAISLVLSRFFCEPVAVSWIVFK